MHTDTSIKQDSMSFNERNDCTVRAIAVTTGLPYAEVHAALKKTGRRNRKGASVFTMRFACKELGFEMVPVTNFPARTIRTAERYLPRGRKFILSVRNHVSGWDGQKIVDWATGRLHRLQKVYEVKAMANDAAPKVRRKDLNKFFVKTIVAKNDLGFVSAPQLYKIVTPPPRVHREKWARENVAEVCAHGHTGVIELKGDAAVAFRKANNVRGRVFMIFGFKRGE